MGKSRGGGRSAIKAPAAKKEPQKKAKGGKAVAYRFFCSDPKRNPTVKGYCLQNGEIHTEFKRMHGVAEPGSPRDVQVEARVEPMTKELAKKILGLLEKKYPKLECRFEKVSAADLDDDEDE